MRHLDKVIYRAGERVFMSGVPIFTDRDHSLCLRSGLIDPAPAKAHKRPLFMFWLDAHSNFDKTSTSQSLNINTTSVIYQTGKQVLRLLKK